MDPQAILSDPFPSHQRSLGKGATNSSSLEQRLNRLESLLAEHQLTQSTCDAFLLKQIVALEQRVEEDRDGCQ
jgi:hypothetical protein